MIGFGRCDRCNDDAVVVVDGHRACENHLDEAVSGTTVALVELRKPFAQRAEECRRAMAQADQDLFDLVVEMRRAGYPYAEVGEVLGVTRQGAWERFHEYVDEMTKRDG